MDKKLQYELSLKDLLTGKMRAAVKETERMDKTMSGLGSKLKNLAIGFGGLALGKAVIETTAKFQSLSNAITAASGSGAAGAKNLKFLNEQVDRLGLDINAAYSGYKTFSGALMGSTLAGDRTNTIFRQVSEAATVMGLSGEQTEGAFLALGQMVSKGTVQAEELRGQLAERIPGAFQIAARAMGVTTQELGKMLQKGEVVANDFLPKFGAELEKQFGSKATGASQSLQSNLNRLDASWERLKVTLGNAFLPVIIKVSNVLTTVLNILPKFFPVIKILTTLIGAYILKTKIGAITSFNFALAQRAVAMGMSKSAIATGFLSRGIRGIGAAIKAVPIIGWIAAIAEGVGYLWDKFEGFRVFVWGAMETFMNFGKFMSGLFTGLGNIIKGAMYNMPNTIQLGVQQIKSGALDTHLATQSGVKGRMKAKKSGNAAGGSMVLGGSFAGGGPLKDSLATGGGTVSASGGGTDISSSKPQSIIINIENLVKEMSLNTTNLSESSTAIRAEVSKALMEALNDVNAMAK